MPFLYFDPNIYIFIIKIYCKKHPIKKEVGATKRGRKECVEKLIYRFSNQSLSVLSKSSCTVLQKSLLFLRRSCLLSARLEKPICTSLSTLDIGACLCVCGCCGCCCPAADCCGLMEVFMSELSEKGTEVSVDEPFGVRSTLVICSRYKQSIL